MRVLSPLLAPAAPPPLPPRLDVAVWPFLVGTLSKKSSSDSEGKVLEIEEWESRWGGLAALKVLVGAGLDSHG